MAMAQPHTASGQGHGYGGSGAPPEPSVAERDLLDRWRMLVARQCEAADAAGEQAVVQDKTKVWPPWHRYMHAHAHVAAMCGAHACMHACMFLYTRTCMRRNPAHTCACRI
eukprot:365173-Chlamydomonas_euryale.AAC.2